MLLLLRLADGCDGTGCGGPSDVSLTCLITEVLFSTRLVFVWYTLVSNVLNGAAVVCS